MTDSELPGAIIGRLSRVRAIESQLVDRFEQLATARAIDSEERDAFTRQSALATRHGQALEEAAGRGGTDLHRSEPMGGHRGNGHAHSVLLEDALAAAASAVAAYGALYASGRLLYEGDVCDLAHAHAAKWAVELAALNDLLAPAVHAA